MALIADVSLELRTRKTWLNKCLKTPVSEDPSTTNMLSWIKHCWNLSHTIFSIFKSTQMQLSQKKKAFFAFFWTILKSWLNSEHFQRKITIILDVFPNLWTPKNMVIQMSKESRLRGPFDRQHGKGDQALLKPEPQHFYHIYWSLLRQTR